MAKTQQFLIDALACSPSKAFHSSAWDFSNCWSLYGLPDRIYEIQGAIPTESGLSPCVIICYLKILTIQSD